ncbi:hypothetical protein BGW37DRAFT_236790 [Umbelopsis sp. PMI_123]|nr:hypothetical protein BGW37DRAFT_236790 [Umbelopsis sp. PMI_123]
MHKYFRPIAAAVSTSFSTASLIPPVPSVRPHHLNRSDIHSEPMLFSVLTPTEDNDVAYSMHEASPQLSEEMLITRTCIEDHMMVTYLKALQHVWEHSVRKRREPHEHVPTPTPMPSVKKEYATDDKSEPSKHTTAPNFGPLDLPVRSKTYPPDAQYDPWPQADNVSDPSYQHDQQQGWFSRLFTKTAR